MPFELFLLSCVACCHDFDKALQSALPKGFEHGRGSGDFVRKNMAKLGLTRPQANAISNVISIHNLNPDQFQRELRLLNTNQASPVGSYNLQRLAVLLKAADILHCDNSRIPSLEIEPDKLEGLDRKKHLCRCCTDGWSTNGTRIVIQSSPRTKEEIEAVRECLGYMKNSEWPAVSGGLERYNFPYQLEMGQNDTVQCCCLKQDEKELRNKDLFETDKKSAQKAYKVFVSSTYRDNEERRRIVQDAITMAGMVWHGMEIFTASTSPTVEECLRYAREADLLVGIIAWRYGWEPEGQEKSITEMEYDAATEILMFLIDPSLPVKQEKDFDPGPDRWKKQEKLEVFKERFSKDQMPAYFNETTLQAKVLDALNKWREKREIGRGGELAPESYTDLEELNFQRLGEKIRCGQAQFRLPQEPLAIAGLFSRWFNSCQFFAETALKLGLSAPKVLFNRGAFERWYTLACHCRDTDCLGLLEETTLPLSPYVGDWSAFPASTKPAGELTELARLSARVAQLVDNPSFMPLDNGTSRSQDKIIHDLGLLALDRIWRTAKDEQRITFIDQARTELELLNSDSRRLERLSRAQNCGWIKDGEFKEPNFAFATAATYLANWLRTVDKSVLYSTLECMLQASQRAMPSRYALLIALLQTNTWVRQQFGSWRDYLLDARSSSLSAKERRAHLALLSSVTCVLLDADSEINRSGAIAEVVDWAYRAKLDDYVIDLMLQLGEQQSSVYISCLNRSKNSPNRYAAARAIRIFRDEKIGGELPSHRELARAIRTASITATAEEIRSALEHRGHFPLWLELLPDLPSPDQLEVLRDIALGVMRKLSDNEHHQAVLRLALHPIPSLIWQGFDGDQRINWLKLLSMDSFKIEEVRAHLASIKPLLTAEEKRHFQTWNITPLQHRK